MVTLSVLPPFRFASPRCTYVEKDSVFEPHQGTRGRPDMLVVIYPTPHEGGEHVLRHNGREWTLDAKSLTVSQSPPSLAHITLYSDIEREVLKVTSGRMVTVTYNLHLVDPTSESKASAVTLNPVVSSSFRAKLKGLLESPEFLPEGGTLGFGLTHRYHITFLTNLPKFASRLKGEDAHVYRSCRKSGLKSLVGIIYEDDDYDSGPGYGIMSEKMVHEPTYDCSEMSDEEVNTYGKALLGDEGCVLVNIVQDVKLGDSHWVADGWSEGEFITWITPFNERNRLHDINVTGVDHKVRVDASDIHCSPCIIVRVPPASDRV